MEKIPYLFELGYDAGRHRLTFLIHDSLLAKVSLPPWLFISDETRKQPHYRYAEVLMPPGDHCEKVYAVIQTLGSCAALATYRHKQLLSFNGNDWQINGWLIHFIKKLGEGGKEGLREVEKALKGAYGRSEGVDMSFRVTDYGGFMIGVSKAQIGTTGESGDLDVPGAERKWHKLCAHNAYSCHVLLVLISGLAHICTLYRQKQERKIYACEK